MSRHPAAQWPGRGRQVRCAPLPPLALGPEAVQQPRFGPGKGRGLYLDPYMRPRKWRGMLLWDPVLSLAPRGAWPLGAGATHDWPQLHEGAAPRGPGTPPPAAGSVPRLPHGHCRMWSRWWPPTSILQPTPHHHPPAP